MNADIGGVDAMTSLQNQSLAALPNVLRDQTIPNTLGGVGAPRPAPRQRTVGVSRAVLGVIAAVVIAALLALLARA
jgi:hypothetical protein